MSITKESELIGMQKVSEAVAHTLKEMKKFVKPGITTKELDDFGAEILKGFGQNQLPTLPISFLVVLASALIMNFVTEFLQKIQF